MIENTLVERTEAALVAFTRWLDAFGELSQDHQDFYAGRLGRAAKALYYRQPLLGKAAVLPMVFCEAFLPGLRRLFYPPMRLPIADAHYAMGYAYRHASTGEPPHHARAVHFLEVLEQTRCKGYSRHGWGYPFDWQTRRGVIPAGTPLITTTPYCYEAFAAVHEADENPRWREIMHSTAEHALRDYRDVDAGGGAMTCSYTPSDGEWVVNASAYRGFLLVRAAHDFGEEQYWQAAEPNLRFVLQSQQADGSWLYAMDGTRDFIDHFHTCFVLKALAKIEKLTGHKGCTDAIERGVAFYLRALFDEHGLPRPFCKAPRVTVYRQELYDCAECINLAVLLHGRFPELDAALHRVVNDVLVNWRQDDGSFRSRKLLLGWDSVPMHRWGQSEMFRSLSFLVATARAAARRTEDASACVG